LNSDKQQVREASETEDDRSILLDIKDLKVHFHLAEGILKAVDGVNLVLRQGETLGLVGESGCGKSVTAQAILRIVPKPGTVSGQILFRSSGQTAFTDIGKLSDSCPEIRSIRGGKIGMIFQEPMKAFSPIHTIGNQIMEALLLHEKIDKKAARKITLDLLTSVGMSNPEQRIDEYPHQLSGGMRQRAIIAMALCCKPSILIADEPTTALDVTVQAQVLKLMNDLQQALGMSMIFITHDLGVIAEMANNVAVMYLGKIIEYCDVDSLFYEPVHPYTQALLDSIPAIGTKARTRLRVIEGSVPVPLNTGRGCGFYSRCRFAIEGLCNVEDPPLVQIKPGHLVMCFLHTTQDHQE